MLGIAAIAVLAILFASWLASDSQSDAIDPSGDWVMVDRTFGCYEDGVPTYTHSDMEMKISFEKLDRTDYCYIMASDDGLDAIWVLDGDMMMTPNLSTIGNSAFLSMQDDVLFITSVRFEGAEVMTFVREGSSASALPEYDPIPSFIEEDTALDALSVSVFETYYEDLTGDNYKMVIDRVESDMFFYRVINDVTETKCFVCVNCYDDQFIATSVYDSNNYILDLVRLSDDVAYISSYDNFGEGDRFWRAIYGDESKVEYFDGDLDGALYRGMEYATQPYLGGGLVYDPERVTLYVIWQFDDQVYFGTKTEDGVVAHWGGLIHKVNNGYEASVQSQILMDGKTYYGHYTIHFSKNLGTATVYGMVDGDDCFVFKQVYNKRETLFVT